MPSQNRTAQYVEEEAALGRNLFDKVTLRLIPFLFLLYIVAYLDRVNVSFAQLQMKGDLGFSDAVYGFGAGVFFIGYFLFEVPSNLILERVGARLWIARIMITWGIIAAAMMFVKSALSFYCLRFLLGVGEAGFFPGIILYLTYWFPASQRARVISLFMTATAIAGVVGSPISGALLKLHVGNLAGWQWLFLLEGLPSVILGAVVFFFLTDRPEAAHWLSVEERSWLTEQLRVEREEKERREHYSLGQALRNGKVWLLSLIYFTLVIGLYGISLWLPQFIKGASGLGTIQIGFLSAIPFAVAAIGMVFVGRHSDHSRERRWHVAVPLFVGGIGFVMSVHLHTPYWAVATFSIAALGVWGALGPFWALPASFLSGTAAAGGIALINSVGNLGGFVGPYLLGLAKNVTDSFNAGLWMLSVLLCVGGFLVLRLRTSDTP